MVTAPAPGKANLPRHNGPLAILLPLGLLAAATGTHPLANAQASPLAIRAVSDLTFGKVAVLGQSGMIYVDAASGGKSARGGAVDLGGLSQSARIEIIGPANGLVSLTPLPGRFYGPRGSTLTFTPSLPARVMTLDANGKASFRLGGAILIPPTATPGLYTGQIMLELSVISCAQDKNCVTGITQATVFSLDFDFQ